MCMICNQVIISITLYALFFFFNDTATTEIYTLSLHDALPISIIYYGDEIGMGDNVYLGDRNGVRTPFLSPRSEEHTSELQSQSNLVCRLLLEKKKKKKDTLDLRKYR